MDEINNKKLSNLGDPLMPRVSSPDFSKISEKPKKNTILRVFVVLLKILAVFLILAILVGGSLALAYYRNFKQAADLSFSAKDHLEQAMHAMVNRDFAKGAELIKEANSEFKQAKILLDKVVLVRQIPYVRIQIQAVDKLLISGINLTDSGEKIALLVEDIIEPLQNESITYATMSPQQKKDILNKIVGSEALFYEVKADIDEAVIAIDAIPEEKLVKPLRDGIQPLKENLPKAKEMIDHVLPMLRIVPKIVGFEQPESYLFLLQNNNELRPTGGFIGTYGILTLQDGEIKEFQTDNVYNLDRSTQPILKTPSPEPIVKYLEQANWSLRDSNWSPDFPTAAEQALYFYREENLILAEIKKQGGDIKGDADVIIQDTVPYVEVNGVIAMTPEIIEELLKITGPIVVEGTQFTDENLQDELEYIVGKKYIEMGVARAERKGVIKKLADELKLKLQTLPLQRVIDLLQLSYRSLDKKQVLIYSKDAELQKMIVERGWSGAVADAPGDYLFVIDSNLGSLKTDQYVERAIDYSLRWQGNDLIAKVVINYQNNADFTWKSSRLRSYTRIYVPLGSELINNSGSMYNDKVRDPERKPGQVDVSQEFNKTVYGAFISIEPHEKGALMFEYRLPEQVKAQIKNGGYVLLIQKQPGVTHNLTLSLNFDKNIKSANPPEQENEWFNTSYNYSSPLDKDSYFYINFK